MAARSKDYEFDSLLSAYAWCALRRHFRSFLSRDVGFLACVSLENSTLTGYFENAGHRLFGNRAPTGVRILEDDAVIHHVRGADRRLSAMIGDLGFRRSMFLFTDGDELPSTFRSTAHICVEIGKPDPGAMKATVFQYRGIRLDDEDAEFLATVPILDVAIALRRGVGIKRGLRILRNAMADEADKKLGIANSQPASHSVTPNADALHKLRGYGEAVDWGLQLVRDLDDYRRGKIGWDSVERGLLLYGPPGTGKTRFADALAKASAVPIFAASYAEWQRHGHQGDMLKAMRKTFKDAADSAPSIIAIDEIDTFVSRSRGLDNDNYMVGVTNALLEHLDGLRGREGVVVVATTNRIEDIDSAILRAGRIDTHIQIELPDANDRCAIVEGYLNTALPDRHREDIVKRTRGSSGADLEVLVRRAHRLARTRGVLTTADHLLEVIPQLSKLSDELLWTAAVHESGHVVVGLAVGAQVETASIDDGIVENAARHRSGVVEFARHSAARFTRETLDANITVILGGLAAEQVILGLHDTGSSTSEASDLALATSIATRVQVVYGMGDTFISEASASEVELRVLRRTNPLIWNRVDLILREAMERARNLVTERRDAVLSLARELMRLRTMTGAEINHFLHGNLLSVSPARSVPNHNPGYDR